MTPDQRSDSTDTTDSHDSTAGSDAAATIDVAVAARSLTTALDAAGALVDECLLRFDDGLVLRARDPADVAMADLRLSAAAFEAYDAADCRFGVALDRFSDAVSMASGDEPVAVTLTDSRRFRVDAGTVTYTLAPIDPDAVRRVEWISGETTTARAVLPAVDVQRAVRAADLVADHATLSVDPDSETIAVAAEGDTDDVDVTFERDDLEAFDAGPVESIYSIQYLRTIVDAIPADAPVTLAFLDADAGDTAGGPLSVRYPFADGDGTGKWLLAPRIRR